jgi:hypothetical protein
VGNLSRARDDVSLRVLTSSRSQAQLSRHTERAPPVFLVHTVDAVEFFGRTVNNLLKLCNFSQKLNRVLKHRRNLLWTHTLGDDYRITDSNRDFIRASYSPARVFHIEQTINTHGNYWDVEALRK